MAGRKQFLRNTYVMGQLKRGNVVRIALLDKEAPSMLDTRKINEIKRGYDYLNNLVLTSPCKFRLCRAGLCRE